MMKPTIKTLWDLSLSLHRARRGPVKPISQFDPRNTRRILVVSCTAIGDTLLSTPSLRTTRLLFPEAHISWLLRDRYAEFFASNPDADEVILYRGAYRKVFRLVRQLKKRRYDLCLVFHDSDPCPVQAAFLAGVPFIMRSGFKDEIVVQYLSFRVPYRDEAHIIEQRMDVLRSLLKLPLNSPGDTRVTFPLHPELVDRQWRKFAQDYGVHPRDELMIGFQISAARSYKAWPARNFAALATRILESYPQSRIFLFGGPRDGKLARQIREKLCLDHRVISLAGSLRLAELPSALKGLDLLVTNDTGPFHLAIALRIPTISLFVPSTVRHTGPYQDPELHIVVRKPRPCSPCLQKYCPEPFCMQSIDVAEVFNHLQAQLATHVHKNAAHTYTA